MVQQENFKKMNIFVSWKHCPRHIFEYNINLSNFSSFMKPHSGNERILHALSFSKEEKVKFSSDELRKLVKKAKGV